MASGDFSILAGAGCDVARARPVGRRAFAARQRASLPRSRAAAPGAPARFTAPGAPARFTIQLRPQPPGRAGQARARVVQMLQVAVTRN